MQRTYSLKKNAQFKYVYRRGASAGAREMVMLYVRGPVLKVGFSVGKKLGCAVQRNRIKRRLRADVRARAGSDDGEGEQGFVFIQHDHVRRLSSRRILGVHF